MNKFKVGDRIKHMFGDKGKVISIIEREGRPPLGWYPTSSNWTPPKTPKEFTYKILWLGNLANTANGDISVFEETIELDKEYYIMISRENKLTEIGI